MQECRYTQSCPTLCDPMDCGPSGSFVHGIFQARILEWIVISFSKESFWSRNWTYISCISCVSRWVLYQLSHQGSPIKGMCTLLIFLTKDSTLMMVGVKTLIQMASSMSLLEYVAQWSHNCIPVIMQWGVSLLVHYYQALLDVMLTVTSEVQVLTFFLQMLGLPCVLLGWPHSVEQWLILSEDMCPSCGLLVSCALNQGYGRSRYHLVLTDLVTTLSLAFLLLQHSSGSG